MQRERIVILVFLVTGVCAINFVLWVVFICFDYLSRSWLCMVRMIRKMCKIMADDFRPQRRPDSPPEQPPSMEWATYRARALQESAGPPSQVQPSALPEVELQDERKRLVRACLFRRRLEDEATVSEIERIFAARRALPSPAESSSTPAEPPPPSRPECSICLKGYRAGQTICWSKTDKCDHIFHSKCIEEWMIQNEKDDCPLCRFDLMSFHSVP